MRISNKVSDKDRHYLNNLIISGLGEVPINGKVSNKATHKLVVESNFIVGAEKIIRKSDLGKIEKKFITYK